MLNVLRGMLANAPMSPEIETRKKDRVVYWDGEGEESSQESYLGDGLGPQPVSNLDPTNLVPHTHL